MKLLLSFIVLTQLAYGADAGHHDSSHAGTELRAFSPVNSSNILTLETPSMIASPVTSSNVSDESNLSSTVTCSECTRTTAVHATSSAGAGGDYSSSGFSVGSLHLTQGENDSISGAFLSYAQKLPAAQQPMFQKIVRLSDLPSENILQAFHESYDELQRFHFNELEQSQVFYYFLIKTICDAILKEINKITIPLKHYSETEAVEKIKPYEYLTETINLLCNLYEASSLARGDKLTGEPFLDPVVFQHKIFDGVYSIFKNLFAVLHQSFGKFAGEAANTLRIHTLEKSKVYAHKLFFLIPSLESIRTPEGEPLYDTLKIQRLSIQPIMDLNLLYQITYNPIYKTEIESLREIEIERGKTEHLKYYDTVLSMLSIIDMIKDYNTQIKVLNDREGKSILDERKKILNLQLLEKTRFLNNIMNLSRNEGDDLQVQLDLAAHALNSYLPSLYREKPLNLYGSEPNDVRALEALEIFEKKLKDLVRFHKPHSIDDIPLKEIYQYHWLKTPTFFTDILSIICLQIRSNHIDQALERAAIFCDLIEEHPLEGDSLVNKEKLLKYVRYLYNLCQTFSGNISFSSVEVHLYPSIGKSVRRHQKTHEKLAERARRGQAEALRIKALRAKAQAEFEATQAAVRAKRLARKYTEIESSAFEPTTTGEAYHAAPAGSHTITDDMAAAARWGRHLQAEKLRRHEREVMGTIGSMGGGGGGGRSAAGAGGPSTEVTTSLTDRAEDYSLDSGTTTAAVDKSLDPIDMNVMIHLTGTSARVEKEIQDRTWNITRADLMTYLKALGCSERKMSGTGHQVFNFPEIAEIQFNGQIHAFIPEQGGAATLPSPGSFTHIFPYYLRKQILVLRSYIYEMRRSALESVAQSETAAAELLAEESNRKSTATKRKGNRKGK